MKHPPSLVQHYSLLHPYNPLLLIFLEETFFSFFIFWPQVCPDYSYKYIIPKTLVGRTHIQTVHERNIDLFNEIWKYRVKGVDILLLSFLTMKVFNKIFNLLDWSLIFYFYI